MRQQARHQATLFPLYDGGRHSLQRRRPRSARDGGELVAAEVQRPAGHNASDSQEQSGTESRRTAARPSRCPLCMRTTQVRGCGSRRGTKRPSGYSMMEGGTHCNVAGHVVPAMLVSMLSLRASVLRGTTPGAAYSGTESRRTAAQCQSRCPLCTRTTQVRVMRQQARHQATLFPLYDGGRHSLQRRRPRSARDGAELVVAEVQRPAGHNARSSQGLSRAAPQHAQVDAHCARGPRR
jgi:hypothetical protein